LRGNKEVKREYKEEKEFVIREKYNKKAPASWLELF